MHLNPVCTTCIQRTRYILFSLACHRYFVEIFRQSPETNEIVFHADGSWSPLKQPKEMHVIATNSPITPASKSDSNSTSTSHTVPSHTGNTWQGLAHLSVCLSVCVATGLLHRMQLVTQVGPGLILLTFHSVCITIPLPCTV